MKYKLRVFCFKYFIGTFDKLSFINIGGKKNKVGIIRKIKNKNAKSTMAKMYIIIRDEKLSSKSITVDNGLKFQMMGIIAKKIQL